MKKIIAIMIITLLFVVGCSSTEVVVEEQPTSTEEVQINEDLESFDDLDQLEAELEEISFDDLDSLDLG